MDKAEALAILERQLGLYRRLPFRDLLRLIDESEALEVIVPGGTTYQIKIHAFWDDETRVHLRVMGSIDDGGWRAVVPLTSDFIIAPDGSFVGE